MSKLGIAALIAGKAYDVFTSHRERLLQQEQARTDDSVRTLRAHFRPVDVVNVLWHGRPHDVAVYFTKEDWSQVAHAIRQIQDAPVVIDGESNGS